MSQECILLINNNIKRIFSPNAFTILFPNLGLQKQFTFQPLKILKFWTLFTLHLDCQTRNSFLSPSLNTWSVKEKDVDETHTILALTTSPQDWSIFRVMGVSPNAWTQFISGIKQEGKNNREDSKPQQCFPKEGKSNWSENVYVFCVQWDTWALQVGAMFQNSWWTDCVLRGAMQCKRHREDQHGKWVTAQKSGNSNLGPQRPPFSMQPSDYPSHLPSRWEELYSLEKLEHRCSQLPGTGHGGG